MSDATMTALLDAAKDGGLDLTEYADEIDTLSGMVDRYAENHTPAEIAAYARGLVDLTMMLG